MGDLKVGEAFRDIAHIIETATGTAFLLQVPTVVVVDEAGNNAVAGNATEYSNGDYYFDFTPDAAGTWTLRWTCVGGTFTNNYIHYFKVGGGTIADIYAKVDTEVATIDTLHDVPAQNAVTNSQIRDVVGNKTDEPTYFDSETASLMRYAKAGAIVGGGVSYSGICDGGMGASTTVIVCDDLKGFGDDYFNTDWVMTVALNDNSHGAAPETNYPRDITDYETATGTFTTVAFSANVEASDRVIISKRHLHLIDNAAILAPPASGSLTYRLSQYLASGDGDFVGGTALPSNVSLYDILGGTNGHPAFPAAAAPANGVSLAEVLHLVSDRTEHHEITKTFFSPSQIEVVADTSHTDANLPTVTLPNIVGTITHVYAGFKFRMVENTNAAVNKLSGAQEIQVDTVDAINFVDDQFSLAASMREGGDCIIGSIDMVATVDVFNHAYSFVWDEPLTDQDALHFNDVQTFLIVSYY